LVFSFGFGKKIFGANQKKSVNLFERASSVRVRGSFGSPSYQPKDKEFELCEWKVDFVSPKIMMMEEARICSW
jgi:hypothetical protein